MVSPCKNYNLPVMAFCEANSSDWHIINTYMCPGKHRSNWYVSILYARTNPYMVFRLIFLFEKLFHHLKNNIKSSSLPRETLVILGSWCIAKMCPWFLSEALSCHLTIPDSQSWNKQYHSRPQTLCVCLSAAVSYYSEKSFSKFKSTFLWQIQTFGKLFFF